MNLRTRVRRLETRAAEDATARPSDTFEGWTDRFTAASPAHERILAEVQEFARTFLPGYLPLDGGRMHAERCDHSLAMALRFGPEVPLQDSDGKPPDFDYLKRLRVTLIKAAVAYQKKTGDLYPRRHCVIRHLATGEPIEPPMNWMRGRE